MILKIVAKYTKNQGKMFLDDVISIQIVEAHSAPIDASDIINLPIVLSNAIYELDKKKNTITITGSTNSVYSAEDFMSLDNDLEVLSIGYPNSIPYVGLIPNSPIYVVQ